MGEVLPDGDGPEPACNTFFMDEELEVRLGTAGL